MRVPILLIAFLIIANNLPAQFSCGTPDEYHQEIDQNKLNIIKKKLAEKSLENDSVAVTFHIVNNAVNIEVVLNEITLLNNYFAGADITFFACGSPRYIEGGSTFSYNEGDILNQRNHVANTVNVYYARQVQDNAGNDLCGYAYFPGLAPQDRYAIVSTAGGCLVGASTLAHELGHFYGLPHTHALNGGRELVDGSNCRTTGDRFCDTPADPNLGRAGVVDNSCRYIGGERDPRGNIYKPLVSNLMSYAPPRCSNKFSNEQLARVRLAHETENNFVLDQCNFFPDFQVSTQTNISTIRSDEKLSVDYEFINKGVQDDFEVPVFIYLSDDPNQRGFIIKKDTINFSALEGAKLETFDIDVPLNSSSNKYYLTILIDPNFKFLELQETNNLFTLEFSIDNQGLEDELVFPNPSTGNFKLFIRDPRIANTFILSIYDTDGRLKKRLEGFKNQDEYFQEIDISEFREGLYIMDVYFVKHDRRKTFKIYKTD